MIQQSLRKIVFSYLDVHVDFKDERNISKNQNDKSQKNDAPEMAGSHACIIYAERRASLRGKDTFLGNF